VNAYGCSAKSAPVTVQVYSSSSTECTTGLNPNQESIQIYPNPSQGIFDVKMPQVVQNGTYEVYSSSGLRISDGSFTGNHIKLNLVNSPKGCYYLKISNKQKSWSEKLII